MTDALVARAEAASCRSFRAPADAWLRAARRALLQELVAGLGTRCSRPQGARRSGRGRRPRRPADAERRLVRRVLDRTAARAPRERAARRLQRRECPSARATAIAPEWTY